MFNLLAIPIQASLFTLYGSASCIAPYIGIYLLKYTIANKQDLGAIQSISAIANIILRLSLAYVADRYRVHRLVYLACTLVYLVGSASLIGPILLPNNQDNLTDGPQHSLEALQWFYLVASLSIISELSLRVNMNLGDAFCANVAIKTNSSYSAIRFWGAVGRSIVAIILIFVNHIEPFLIPALIISTILTTINALVIAFWPNKESFDMSDKIEITNEEEHINDQDVNSINGFSGVDNNLMRIKFSYNKHWKLGKKRISSCMADMQVLDLENLSNKNKFKSPVKIKRLDLSRKSEFDSSREEDVFRNVRRCSLAPLGDSFVIKQFELDNKNVKHFNHVIKIEPINQQLQQLQAETITPIRTIQLNNLNESSNSSNIFEWPANEDYADKIGRRRRSSREEDKNKQQNKANNVGKVNYDKSKMIDERLDEDDEDDIENNSDLIEDDRVGFLLYMRIIGMIAMRNKQLIQFMLLYVINGITAAVNWIYLFPYLESLDSDKFAQLSVYVLFSRYLSETIFYYVSPKALFNSISHPISLSIILLIYGLRFSLYPLLGSPFLPLETIIIIEALRALNIGWFNCVSNEAALKFAAESTNCIPELVASGYIDNNKHTIDRLNTGFKATMVVISACCFDGLGFALGSYVGGVLTEKFNYKFLWLATGGLAVLASVSNLLVELLVTGKRKRKSNSMLEIAI